jgi:hypothetical protein
MIPGLLEYETGVLSIQPISSVEYNIKMYLKEMWLKVWNMFKRLGTGLSDRLL